MTKRGRILLAFLLGTLLLMAFVTSEEMVRRSHNNQKPAQEGSGVEQQ